MMRALRLCLVGSQQQENLGVAYLAGAAEAAGHHVRVESLEAHREVGEVAERILSAEPDVVGLSMAFQHAVDESLALARALRERGFDGHLTCGGHVPTFCFAELLRDCPGLDTVVRFEGERTLVELLDALARGERPRDIDGLVWRDGDGCASGGSRPLCAELDALPAPRRREQPFAIGGVPMAFILTARGCPGDCSYCCLAAFTAGAGGTPFRVRQPDAVAEEIAELRSQRGVRVVVVQDDLFVLPSERSSIARMDAMSEALRRRGIDDVILWIKGRPDDITAPVLEAAARLGAIHLFLGVENAVERRLRYLGRSHRPAHNQRALELCRAGGIRASFNLMLFDPDCTLQEVATTIDFGAAHTDATWNICRTEIYSGTALRERLAAQGRLEGDYRGYGYRIGDARAEVAFRIMRSCMQERAFACDSLINRLISLSFARQVHQRLLPGASAEVLSRQVDALGEEIYRDTVSLMRQALEIAAAADLADHRAVHEAAVELAMSAAERDAPWSQRAADLWQRLTARGRTLLRT